MKKLKLFRTLLVAAMLGVGGSAWGAPTLTSSQTVAGYKLKAYYDFTTNTPAVLPTSGDLCYRAGWGLHNYGSGTRSATASIPVAVGDIIVIEKYHGNGGAFNDADVTINRGSFNSTITTAINKSGFVCYDITSTADDVTFSNWRYLGIRAALVMEVDNDVETANYTINYKCGGETVKTVSGTDVAVGTVIPVLSSFIEGGKKYITDGGQASSLTVESGGSTLTINVTEAAKYTCTVNAKAGDLLLATKEEAVYEGEGVTIYYQMAYEKSGKWYFIDRNSSAPGYGVTFNSVTSDQTENKTTYSLNDDVVYFGEAEDMTLSGSFAADGNYLNWRSNGGAKRLGAGAYIYSSTIAPGVYEVTLWARNNRSAGDGTETLPIFLRDKDGNLTDLGVSFPGWDRGGYEAAKTAAITIPDDGKSYSVVINNNTIYNSNLELDYLYVTFVRPISVSATLGTNGYATFASPYALDLTSLPSGLKAYKASVAGSTVTFTEVTEAVQANTGLLLEGTASTSYNIPVAATGSNISASNALLVNAAGTTFDAESGYSYYGLNKDIYPLTFGTFNPSSVAIPANKAYLKVASTAARLSVVFGDESTGISNVSSQMEEGRGYYDLQGRRVAQPTKGLYIVNGKKVVIK